MITTCRILPSYDQCCSCIDVATDHGNMIDCNTCKRNAKDGLLINVNPARFLGKPRAIVAVDGILQKVPIDRVFDIRSIN